SSRRRHTRFSRDWSSDVCSSDLARLLKSLDARPPRPELLLVRNADDQMALATLSREPEIAQLATSADSVALLWEVCQVPDFRKRSEERRVGNEWKARWPADDGKP